VNVRVSVLLLGLLLGCAAPTSLAGGRALDLHDALSQQVSYVALSAESTLLGEAGQRPDVELHQFPMLSVVVVNQGRMTAATSETFVREVGPIDTPTRAILRAWMTGPRHLRLSWADDVATAEVLEGGALVLLWSEESVCRDNGESLGQVFRVLLFVSSEGEVEERGRSLVEERVVARGCRDRPR
jgi:hypothetical protein